MPTNAEKGKISVAIEDMEKQIAELRKDYERVKKFNSAAWNEFGSELCANEMIANERKISDKINKIQKTIDLFNDFLAGKISLSDEQNLLTADRLCVVIIKEHEDRRTEFKARLEEILLIKSFL